MAKAKAAAERVERVVINLRHQEEARVEAMLLLRDRVCICNSDDQLEFSAHQQAFLSLVPIENLTNNFAHRAISSIRNLVYIRMCHAT